jgi:hypothetical protein
MRTSNQKPVCEEYKKLVPSCVSAVNKIYTALQHKQRAR